MSSGMSEGPYLTHVVQTTMPLPNGPSLATTVFRPAGEHTAPTVLLRTPYGRAQQYPEGIFWASHGYNAVVQDTRSSTSYFHEADDGAETVAWIERQSWFDGRLALTGSSYLGFAALAIASRRPDIVTALATRIYSSDRTSAWYPGGALSLDLTLTWSAQQEATGQPARWPVAGSLNPEMPAIPDEVFTHLPLGEADVALTGEPLPFYRERLHHGPDDPHWKPLDFSSVLETSAIPTLLIDGWFDYHRTYMYQDFERLGRSGAPRRWVIGPWTHSTLDPDVVARETLAWFDRYVRGTDSTQHAIDTTAAEAALLLTPGGELIESKTWPPSTAALVLRPSPDRSLTTGDDMKTTLPREQTLSFTYDPTDPTPAVGLSAFGDLNAAGARDNSNLEARDDVVVFTTDPLDTDLVCVGQVDATLDITSTNAYSDLFVRICDVTPDGRSLNVIHGFVRRVEAAGERQDVHIDLGPIGHRFARGHRVRLQISGGAHPFYDRNLGTGQSWLTGTTVQPCTHHLHLGPVTGTSVTIPVVNPVTAF